MRTRRGSLLLAALSVTLTAAVIAGVLTTSTSSAATTTTKKTTKKTVTKTVTKRASKTTSKTVAKVASPSAPEFELSVTNPVTTTPGGTARISVAVRRLKANVSAITLKSPNLPAGWTLASTANPIEDSATLVVRVPADAAFGSYSISVAASTTSSIVQLASTVVVAPAQAPTTITPVTSQPVTQVSLTTQPVVPSAATTTIPDYSLSVSPLTQAIKPGQTAAYAITINRAGGFTAPVELGVSSPPATVTAFVTPNVATDSAYLTVITQPSTPLGSFDLTITSRNRTARVTVVVTNDPTAPGATTSTAPPSFNVTATPTQQGIGTTGSVQFGIGIVGAPVPVSFAVSALPAGASFAFGAAPTTTDTSLTITTSNAVAGTYPFTVTAVAGTATRTLNLTLIVGNASGFGLKAANDSLTVARGGAGTLAIAIVPQPGFNLPVNFLPVNVGAGISATLNPTSSITGTQLTVTPSSTATTGAYSVLITGSTAGLTASITITVVVT